MRLRPFLWIAALTLAGLPNGEGTTKAAVPAISVQSGVLAVLANRGNPTDDISVADLRLIYLGDMRAWPHWRKVTVAGREIGGPHFVYTVRVVLRMELHEYRRYHLNAAFRGVPTAPPKELNSDEAVCKFVLNVPGAVAVMDSAAASRCEGTKTIRVSGKLPGDSGYPLR